MLKEYIDNYPVSLKKRKIAIKFQIKKKNTIKVGGTQINPNLAVCHKTNSSTTRVANIVAKESLVLHPKNANAAVSDMRGEKA